MKRKKVFCQIMIASAIFIIATATCFAGSSAPSKTWNLANGTNSYQVTKMKPSSNWYFTDYKYYGTDKIKVTVKNFKCTNKKGAVGTKMEIKLCDTTDVKKSKVKTVTIKDHKASATFSVNKKHKCYFRFDVTNGNQNNTYSWNGKISKK